MTMHDEPQITDHDDLIWLADRQPHEAAANPDAAVRARAALLAHIEGGAGAMTEPKPHTAFTAATGGPFALPSGTGPRRRWARRTLAAAAVAAVAITVVVGALPGGLGGAGDALAPQEAEAARLVKLSRVLAAEPVPEGDATLVRRHTVLAPPHSRTIDSYEMILDRGFLNFFGPTLELLRTAQGGTATANGMVESGRGTISGWIEAAARSKGASPTAAAAAIEHASGIPIIAPSKRPEVRARQARVQYENHVWVTALSVMELAGGRPDVRAGALAAISAIGGRSVLRVEGRRTVLAISHRNPATKTSPVYDEILTIDGTTGVPIRFTGGTPGKTAETTVTFETKRVDASDYGH